MKILILKLTHRIWNQRISPILWLSGAISKRDNQQSSTARTDGAIRPDSKSIGSIESKEDQ